MSEFDTLSPPLHYTPTRKEIVRVVRGMPLEDKILRLTLRNQRPYAVVPVFIQSHPFLTVGPLGVLVEQYPLQMDDGREQWRSIESLGAGETRDYFVFLDTEAGGFPPAGTRFYQITLDLFVEEHGYLTQAGSIPIVVREILDTIPAFTGIVSLDFGTTNTCAVVTPHDQWQPRVAVLGRSAVGSGEQILSMIAYHDVADPRAPSYAIGEEASQLFGQPGGDEVISSVKRYVPSGTKFLVGSALDATPVYFRAAEVAGHIVARIRQHIEKFLGQQAVVELTCTYPTAYNKTQLEALRSVFEEVQADASDRYGSDIVPVRMLLDEATAAAIFYLHHRFKTMRELREHISGTDFSVLCYDLGGGTTDLSLTRFSFGKPSAPKRMAKATVEDTTFDVLDFSSTLGAADEAAALPASSGLVAHGRILQRDGMDAFGGDNMTLSVFRLLKVRYALLLADMLQADDLDSVTLEDVIGLRNAGDYVVTQRALLERWTRRGDPLPADAGVGFPGYPGVPTPASVWDAVDVLVPTRFHEGYDYAGKERSVRHLIFADLWRTAEATKIDFGTARSDGEYPTVSEPIPPASLYDGRYKTGPARLSARVTATDLRAHLEPSLMHGFAKAKAMLREENLLTADFFVLAGNACKLPLIRELFVNQFSPFGAVEGWNVLFDPDVAKTAVARGAALYAVNVSAAGGTAWALEEEDHVLHEHLGVLESQSVFADATEPMHAWFARGTRFPAHKRIRLRKDMPSLRLYSTRRLGSPPRLLGAFMFLRESGRVNWHALPNDLEDAVNALTLMEGGTVLADGTYVADVVITERQRIFLQRERLWYALWPIRLGLPDHLNPFSGRQ